MESAFAPTRPDGLAPAWGSRSGVRLGFSPGPRVTFGGCDYLGLAGHPRVAEAARATLDRYGVSAGASRTTSGNTDAHDALEDGLVRFFRVGPERGVALTLDGLTANMAALDALTPEHPLAVIDERCHRSVVTACRAAGLMVERFTHLDPDDCRRVVSRHPLGQRAVVVTDGVFAADGAIAPVAGLHAALPAGGRLVVDDCHGLGVLGPGGRGSLAAAAIDDPRVIVTATLAKGVGAGGGFVLADAATIDRVRRTTTAFVGTTPIAPAIAAAASAALAVIDAEPERLTRVRARAEDLHAGAAAVGWGRGLLGGPGLTPVLAVAPAGPDAMDRLRVAWDHAGLAVPLVTYPGGPAARYFRVSVTADHTADEVRRLFEAAAEAGRTVRTTA